MDFGISARIRPGKKAIFKCGSPGYIAPEVFGDSGYDFKVDVYSCGIILYIL